MYRAAPDLEAGHRTPFSFEHVWAMREADYLAFQSLVTPYSHRARLKLAGMAMLGGLLLTSSLSAGIGVLLLVLTALIWHLPRLSRSALRKRFAETAYLRGPVAYGVSRAGFWLRGAHLSAECDWEGLSAWSERGDWLVLSGSGIAPVYLPIAALREQGLYEAVVFLARAHGRPPRPRVQARDFDRTV